MNSLFYTTGGGNKQIHYYHIKKNKKKSNVSSSNKCQVKRISCQEYDDRTKNKDLGKIKPRIGSKVMIIIKPYNNYDCKIGIVKRVLTNKQIHTRGHKVMLETGIIGRTLKIINL
jgi:uncharacterized repeat protein (TIGR03833 family)